MVSLVTLYYNSAIKQWLAQKSCITLKLWRLLKKYIYGIFMESLSDGGDNGPSRHHMPPSKTSIENTVFCQAESLRKWVSNYLHSRCHRLLPRSLLILHNLMVRLFCWIYNSLMSLNIGKLSWCQLEGLQLLTSINGNARYFANDRRRNKIISNTQL